MFATVITIRRDQVDLQQIEAPTVKDCLIAWAGRLLVEGQTDEGRTRLRGEMADFDQAPVNPFENVWRLKTDLGLGGQAEATVVVIETVRS
jgi:hypothetical protein